MPEGDSVWKAARRMAAGLVGRTVVASDFRVPQHATADLTGRSVDAFTSCGKHMLTRFSGGLTLHTHFEMDGAWQLVGPGKRLPASFQDDIRLVLSTDGPTAYALRMPVLELLATTAESTVIGHLGPDLLGPAWDEAEAVRRLSAEPGRPVVEALLDQRNLAGIGNLWAVETCFLRGVSPWTPAGEVDLPAAVRLVRRMMRHSLEHPGQVTTGNTRQGQTHWVYGRAERPCRRCGTPVAFRDATGGPYERETWWCPSCQPGPFPSLTERPTRPGLRRGVNEESFGSRSRRLGGAPGSPVEEDEVVDPQVGQVVTVFRSRLRSDALQAYADDAAAIAELARSMPGYVEHKIFVADDGERVTLVTFADALSHAGWRDHPEHRAAQRRGIAGYYQTYTIQVGTTSYASAFRA